MQELKQQLENLSDEAIEQFRREERQALQAGLKETGSVAARKLPRLSKGEKKRAARERRKQYRCTAR